MVFTDPIGDMLTRIRNAARVKAEIVDIPHSTLKEEIARILKDEGYVAKYESPTKRGKKVLRVTLKYKANKQSVLSDLKRVSKPGRRIYVKSTSVPRVLAGFGTAILSTPKGVMTDGEARAQKTGGEILCYVW